MTYFTYKCVCVCVFTKTHNIIEIKTFVYRKEKVAVVILVLVLKNNILCKICVLLVFYSIIQNTNNSHKKEE